MGTKKRFIVFGTILFLLVFGLLTSPAAAANRLISREVLFGNPEKTSPQISPDGRRIAYVAPSGGVLNIWVRTIGLTDDRPLTHDRGRGIHSYLWAPDGNSILFLNDDSGDENSCLYRLDLRSHKITALTPFKNVQTRVVAVDKHSRETILISMNKENPAFHDVYRLDLLTGSFEMAAKNPGDISDWVADRRLNVLGAVKNRPDGGTDFLFRENEKMPWKILVGWDLEDSLQSMPLGFSKDGQSVYLKDSAGRNTSAFKKISLQDKKSEVISGDPEYDLAGVMFDPDTYEPQLVSYQKERAVYRALDPVIQRDLDLIGKIENGEFSIVSRDNEDWLWLVGFQSDLGSSVYYMFNRVTGKVRKLFKARPALDAYELAPMEPVQFTSRDGLVVHGYMTFPPQKERRGLPMVLMVHGGPWARDVWGYNARAQWLANRGYICLQVNFRGSTGYGKKFIKASDKEWGGAMQRDLEDAVRWAVEKDYADPKRVGIFGGSYGGYAALAGAAFTPDLFSCAAEFAGPGNLLTFLETIPSYWSVYREQFYRRVGNPETESDFLKSRSPLFYAGKIKIPLLIAQGANDPRVKAKESEQIVAALKTKGLNVEYLLFPDEGHGLVKPENRLKFYAACEKFFAKYLDGSVES